MSDDQAIKEAAADAKTDTRPVKKLSHKGVSIAIFPRTVQREDGTEVTIYNTVIERPYKTDDDTWHASSSFNENQLAVVQDLCREARDFIREAKAAAKQQA